MLKQEIIINSNFDNIPINVTIFIPDSNIKGILKISHDRQECKERYYKFMEYMTNNGYITIINDHRGHGKNAQKIEHICNNFVDYATEDLYQVTS